MIFPVADHSFSNKQTRIRRVVGLVHVGIYHGIRPTFIDREMLGQLGYLLVRVRLVQKVSDFPYRPWQILCISEQTIFIYYYYYLLEYI